MRAINHALTGAIIGLTVGEPAIAVPAAVASHFLMDAIPHYDGVNTSSDSNLKKQWLRSKTFRQLLYADAIMCFVLVLILATKRPIHWLIAIICAFAAAAPDFLSLGLYLRALANKKRWRPNNLYSAFASKIQWFERPIGAVVEVAWFIGAIILLIPLMG